MSIRGATDDDNSIDDVGIVDVELADVVAVEPVVGCEHIVEEVVVAFVAVDEVVVAEIGEVDEGVDDDDAGVSTSEDSGGKIGAQNAACIARST